MSYRLSLALIGAALCAAPALAQTSPPAADAPKTTAAPAGGHFMTEAKPGQWRTSKLKGLNVYNNNNEKIGDIDELLVDRSGKIEAVVIGVGGFLGMGEHDVAVPFSELKFVDEPQRTAATTTTTTTTTTPSAPARPGAPPETAGAPARPAAPPATTGASGTARSDARSYPDHAMLNMTKDQLKAAPEFKYAR